MKKVYTAQSYYLDLEKEYYSGKPFWGEELAPMMVTIKPTMRCVANCTHCEARIKDFDTDGPVFSVEGYRELFRTLKAMGTEKITISKTKGRFVRLISRFFLEFFFLYLISVRLEK